MRWAPRAGVHIDRAACAWLIRRHVDAVHDHIRRSVLTGKTTP